MLYQENGIFKVVPFKAKIGTDTHLVVDKVQFEEGLIMDGSELPTIVYSNNKLSTEQEIRFNELKDIEDITLDEIREYTMTGKVGTSLVFEYLKLKEKNTELQGALFEIMQLIAIP